MFFIDWSSTTDDVIYLISHVISQNHVIKDHKVLWVGTLYCKDIWCFFFVTWFRKTTLLKDHVTL